jgi:GNAT superfamily N-acetyltransferase
MLSIERLDESSWRTLRELRLAALQDAPEAFWATWEDERQYTRQDWVDFASGVVWFVAVRDDAPCARLDVGIVGCLQRQEFPDEPEVIGMWVRPDERGAGTADLLIGAAHRWAALEHVRSIGLWVVDGNERARRFYERHCYRSTGECAPLPAGRAGHEQRMRRTWTTSAHT